ncbi:MAG: hypothetical protein R3C68_15200, partial [Myxococcota bacterium]
SDVPKGALAFGRARQSNREDYAKRLRERLAAAKQVHKPREASSRAKKSTRETMTENEPVKRERK